MRFNGKPVEWEDRGHVYQGEGKYPVPEVRPYVQGVDLVASEPKYYLVEIKLCDGECWKGDSTTKVPISALRILNS
jgi:hypothetical protein